MTTFVHLTAEKNLKSILRTGIKISNSCVYAMPVLPNFYTSHQWLRELKRDGTKTIYGIYFRIPNNEIVSVGYFNQRHQEMTANEANSLLMKLENPSGYEVIIPRKIRAREIRKARYLPQIVGWRYFPNAHGRKPCGCPRCLRRGEIKSRKIRAAYQAQN
ncbi:MAG: hypothetical protein SAL07_06290 [Oscillatoria sp. PMC 1051.18]|nr:hypothetical protein [Oscillatoria sp. PMC 1050.18]MEC5029503.1 hypothetical protein [Oscillatoria sp. PMC 1051.18]